MNRDQVEVALCDYEGCRGDERGCVFDTCKNQRWVTITYQRFKQMFKRNPLPKRPPTLKQVK